MKSFRIHISALAAAIMLAGCSFEAHFDTDFYWKCKPGGECVPGCSCFEGNVCVPDNEGLPPGICAWCPALHRDCDGSVENGCEANIASDADNCGDCGQPCVSDQFCQEGRCVEQCAEGLTQCGRSCVDTSSNALHCGACNESCDPPLVCQAGDCTDACDQGLTECLGGCVDTMTDVSHCGECGHLCIVDNGQAACVQGDCRVDECNEPYLNCDLEVENGCETDTNTDPKNCGVCGVDCGYRGKCHLGSCHCMGGSGNCNDSLADGCETNLLDDPLNCGTCDNDCGQDAHCEMGSCTCDEHHADCNEDQADGCEVDTLSDPLHCGECDDPCDEGPAPECIDQDTLEHVAGPPLCVNGQCDYQVVYEECPHGCEAGKCLGLPCQGDYCIDDEWCDEIEGICRCGYGGEMDVCTDDERCCGNECVTVIDNDLHCGACDRFCGDHSSCIERECFCDDGYGNCDNLWDEMGCESYLNYDSANCGECGLNCGQHAFCAEGSCQCEDGIYYDCNGDLGQDDGNGCETNLMSDPQNCGECQNICLGEFLCVEGLCTDAGVPCGMVTCIGPDFVCCDIGGQVDCIQEGDCVSNVTAACNDSGDCEDPQKCCFDPVGDNLTYCGSDNCPYVLCGSNADCVDVPGKPNCCFEGLTQGLDVHLCLETCP